MFARLDLSSIMIVICLVTVKSAKVKSKIGPGGMSFDDTTNCTVFSKFGRFNPYSVLHEKWFVFFYWAPPKPLTTFLFTFPTANHTKHLKKILEGNTILPVMWSARQILMENQDKEVSLLVERGDRGEYWCYPLYKIKKGATHKISPRDVRLKQTGDNRILGFMDCVDESLLVMARINDVPPKNRLQEEASRLGYRGRRGKSYLYQGHEWLPIPEDDEKNYWAYNKDLKGSKHSFNEVSSEKSSEEDLQTNEPEKSKEEKRSKTDSHLTFNEEEVKARCERIEPELWNDPELKKPEPPSDPNKRRITKDELNSIDTDVPDETQIIEVPENKSAKESESLQENNKADDHQNDAIKNKPSVEKNIDKPKKKKSKSKKPADENCDVCFQMKATNDAYIPENVNKYSNSKDTEIPSPSVHPAETKTQESNGSIEKVIRLIPDIDDLTNQ